MNESRSVQLLGGEEHYFWVNKDKSPYDPKNEVEMVEACLRVNYSKDEITLYDPIKEESQVYDFKQYLTSTLRPITRWGRNLIRGKPDVQMRWARSQHLVQRYLSYR